ncbi:kelch-like protein 26 [Plodia interpunctella]|uniref:kelch-like protein 26 n=1 Tax=Plodia interpunctella TaxID=58824 RepID=UPI002367F5C7|nr:kelch-like protein 26 [Plodia interpunctella]
MGEINLLIEGQTLKAKKDVLCEYSDYFRAMFSGSYIENEQNEIKIDVLDASSMQLILKYMEMGFIDLFEHSLATIGDLAVAANFLQITELIKQIEHTLDLQLKVSNWMEIQSIAENSSYTTLEQLSAAFALFTFNNMKPEYISSIQKLYWYLSHPYLDTGSELEVFKFGFQWMSQATEGLDSILLLLLCCLDLSRLTMNDLKEIRTLIIEYETSLAAKMVDCLLQVSSGGHELSTSTISNQKTVLTESFTERVYNEVMNLVKDSKHRKLKITPMVPVWIIKDSKPGLVPHVMFTYSEETGFEKWLEVAEKNLWGWNVIAWGLTKLVIVCGEYGRGTEMFFRDVKVYDTLKNEWTRHGVELPSRRHGGVAVVGDSLYIVGGVGGFRVVLDTAIVYDLKERSYRRIAKFLDTIQAPAVCDHENMVYAAGHKNIYRYEDKGDTDGWVNVVATEIRMSCMISFKNYIYCTQNYFSHLYRFRPGVDNKLELISYFTNPPAAICNLGNRLLVFTRTMCGQSDVLAVEQYTGDDLEEKPKVLWSQSDTTMKVNDVAGSCSLVLSIPPLCKDIPPYHKRYLARFNH